MRKVASHLTNIGAILRGREGREKGMRGSGGGRRSSSFESRYREGWGGARREVHRAEPIYLRDTREEPETWRAGI